MEATPLATAAEIESETVEGVANGASTIDQAVNSFHKEHQNVFGFGTGADSGSGSAGTESSEDINADEGEDIGMTREIMGSDDTENLTASRVSFDQWMHDHAVLDGERSVEEAGEQDYGYDEYEYVDGLDQNESPGTDIQNAWLNAKSSWAVENGDNTEETAADPNKCGDAISIGSSDGDDASDTDCGDSTGYDEECYNEEMAGDSGGVDVDDYQPDTTAASACGKCTALPQNLQMGLQGFAQPVDAGQDVHMHQFATSALVGTCDSVGLSLDHSFTAMPLNASDQESVASAMRFLADIAGQSIIGGGEPGTLVGMQVSNSEYETALPLEAAEGMAEISDEKTSGKPAGAYKRPPLPLENTAQSLGDMHKAISECIGRSIAIADEISAGCDDAEAKTAVMEHQQPPITESTAGNDAEGTSGELYDDVMALEEDSRESIELANETLCAFEKFCTESIAERDKLNSQIVVLNTEIYRLDTEKLTLKHRIKELEAECTEHSQKTDELECGLKSITEANSKEIEDLKARVRAVASKASSLSGELDSTKHKLEETQQVLAVVSCERTDLIGKCNGLESDLESFTGRLKSEQLAHEETKRALHVARDGNASEARRAELQSLTVKLEQKCTELSKRLARSQDHERLLLNSTRALEARLSDALRRLDEPQRPEDILEDHRREWDAQLVESRKQARNAHEKLAVAEEKLNEERRTNAILRRRIEEMESVYARPGEAARKRKRDTSSTVGPDGSQATASADDCGESFAGALDTTPVSLSGTSDMQKEDAVATPYYTAAGSHHQSVDISTQNPQKLQRTPSLSALHTPVPRPTQAAGELHKYLSEEIGQDQNRCCQAVVNAGEYARDRRRKNGHQAAHLNAAAADKPVSQQTRRLSHAGSTGASRINPTLGSKTPGRRTAKTVDKPVTPRINLRSDSSNKPVVGSLSISSTRRSEILRDLSMARKQRESLGIKTSASSTQRASTTTPPPSRSLTTGIQRGGRSLEYRML